MALGVPLVLALVLAGCSANSANNPTPTTALDQSRSAVVVVRLEEGTSPDEANMLTSRLLKLGGEITGTDWNYLSPDTVDIYLASSETVAEIDALLPRIEKMPQVEGATVKFS